MGHPFGHARLIVNPRAGSGVGSAVAKLRQGLEALGTDHDVVETSRAGESTELARAALDEGVRYLVAVGGDGTVHEVVNGMYDPDADAPGGFRPRAPDAVLGVLGAGSGCDFVRTFGLTASPKSLAKHLASEHTMDIDVGVVSYHDGDGQAHQRLFVNIAEVGYGAEAARLAAKLPKHLGRFRYLFAAWGAIRALTHQEASVTVAQGERTVPLVELVVANCQFFGGGMKVAPRALPQDGKFNVQAYTGQRSQMFQLTTKIYRGEHLPHPDIAEWQSPTAAVDAPTPMLVEADGELLGQTPAAFWLLPEALRLKI